MARKQPYTAPMSTTAPIASRTISWYCSTMYSRFIASRTSPMVFHSPLPTETVAPSARCITLSRLMRGIPRLKKRAAV